MKQILAALLISAMLFSFAGCEMRKPAHTTPSSEEVSSTDFGEITTITNDTSESTETEKPTESEKLTESSQSEKTVGIRPEFKEAMDSYEAFYTEYCRVLKEYSKNPTDLGLLSDYNNLLLKAADVDQAFEAWDESELSDEELQYYLAVNSRVIKMLSEVGG